jgi:hypothetical protein
VGILTPFRETAQENKGESTSKNNDKANYPLKPIAGSEWAARLHPETLWLLLWNFAHKTPRAIDLKNNRG